VTGRVGERKTGGDLVAVEWGIFQKEPGVPVPKKGKEKSIGKYGGGGKGSAQGR